MKGVVFMLRKYILPLLVVLAVIPQICSAEEEEVSKSYDVLEPPDVRIGVIGFQSGAIDIKPEHAMTAGNHFAQRLAMLISESFDVVGAGDLSRIAEDNNISAGDYVSNKAAVEIGRLAGCKYIIAGVITDLKTKNASNVKKIIVRIGKNVDIADAAAYVRVIDTETGEVVLDVSDSVTVNHKESGFISVSGIDPSVLKRGSSSKQETNNKVTGSEQDEINALESAALFLLTSKLALRIRESITGIYPVVTSASKKEITFDLGTLCGARRDMLCRVYTNIDGEEKNIAVVKITEAKADRSKAVLYSKGYGKLSLVRNGDRVFPTDIYAVRPLAKKKAFMKKRPSESKRSDKKKESTKKDYDELFKDIASESQDNSLGQE